MLILALIVWLWIAGAGLIATVGGVGDDDWYEALWWPVAVVMFVVWAPVAYVLFGVLVELDKRRLRHQRKKDDLARKDAN